ncbi:MAG: damage-control phosphatase ARMT1 family protein [Thermoguttaceae bacterium]|jgi:uncharacterized protein with ATP-grasp and redox domains
MSTVLDCYLCLLRQSLEAARYATTEESVQREVLRAAAEQVLEEGFDVPPPKIGRAIHRLIKKITGNPDPYLAEKERFNRAMLEQLPRMRGYVVQAKDPLRMAVTLAIAGNSIDAALGKIKESDVEAAFQRAISQPLTGEYQEFSDAVHSAGTIFLLADNAGEIVCDRVLVEYLTKTLGKSVTAAVRGEPILNDATMDDARFCGLTDLIPVISNGNDGLGTFLDECSPEFLDTFCSADLVIAKGLANYETLVDNKTEWQPRRIAFLFKSKCPFISGYAGTKLGDLVVRLN